MKRVFGPVPSRRLGLSLGLDIIPMKTCSLSCIYCQIGRTPHPTMERKVYVEPELIIEEVKSALKNGLKPDYITFSGSGEPTLNSAIGEMIAQLKSLSDIPIAVITNGLLLWMEKVRQDISEADVVMPSLDAASERLFWAINRPPKGLTLEKVIGGLKTFCDEFKGKIWLEVMLIDGVNTTEDELQRLKNVISGLRVDKVQLNTVVRPPAESNVKPVTPEKMKEIRSRFAGSREPKERAVALPTAFGDFFGEKVEDFPDCIGINCNPIGISSEPRIGVEIIADFTRNVPKIYKAEELHILDMLKRRPCTAEEISDSLGIPFEQVMDWLSSMLRCGIVKGIEHEGRNYYSAGE